MNFADKIRNIPDFPKTGVDFIDITTLLKDSTAFPMAIDCMEKIYKEEKIDIIVGPEARGFIIGSALAYVLRTGFVPVRKKGKLPAPTQRIEYSLEYGSDVVEIHKDAVTKGMRALIVDDVLATGGTALASAQLVEQLGGEIAGFSFLVELSFLNGREKLNNYKISSLVVY